MRILNGSICLKYQCFECCLDTEMILSDKDISRICSLGYPVDYFAYFDGQYWRLKNRNHRCIFLGSNGRCKIYPHRPLGCKAYPILAIEKGSVLYCGIDTDVCPHIQFITRQDYLVGCLLLKKLFTELGEPIPQLDEKCLKKISKNK